MKIYDAGLAKNIPFTPRYGGIGTTNLFGSLITVPEFKNCLVVLPPTDSFTLDTGMIYDVEFPIGAIADESNNGNAPVEKKSTWGKTKHKLN